MVVGGRPTIEAFVVIPRLLRGNAIRLLVDTGADTSVIHPPDAVGLGVDLIEDFIGVSVESTSGVGGMTAEYREVCDILLQHENGRVDHLMINVGFAIPTDWNRRYPSVLGRDILRHYRLTFEEMRDLVTLETGGTAASPSIEST